MADTNLLGELSRVWHEMDEGLDDETRNAQRIAEIACRDFGDVNLALTIAFGGLYVALDGGCAPSIWAPGETPHRPVLLLSRTQENARLFDAVAALLPAEG